MKVLILYSEVVGFTFDFIKRLVLLDNDVVLIHWDDRKLTPFVFDEIPGLQVHRRSALSSSDMLKLEKEFQPDLIYVSGWMDYEYLFLCFNARIRGCPVVSGFDDLWHGSFKQIIGSFFFRFVRRFFFSHAWVSGPYQYEFARRLGFSRDKIVFDLLSCVEVPAINNAVRSKNIVYVGRFSPEKGLDKLLKSWSSLDSVLSDWNLILIGANSPSDFSIASEFKRVTVLPYLPSNEVFDILSHSYVAVMPSFKDQWAVSVHEYVSCGNIVICNENVGSRSVFLINKFNGFVFNYESFDLNDSLEFCLSLLSELDIKVLDEMCLNSLSLSSRISLTSCVANFLSIVKLK